MTDCSDRRQCRRGLKEIIVDQVCLRATASQWAKWLKAPLQDAAAAGDRTVTLKLLATGAQGDGMMAVAQGGHPALVDDLLQPGAYTTERNEEILHVAATLGHSEVVSCLLREGTDANERDSRYTALDLAAERGHLSTVQVLLAAGTKVNVLPADSSHSPLALACRGGHVGTVKTLIHHGADVKLSTTAERYTPLHNAAMYNHPRCITALVDAGADVESKGGCYSSEITPLHCAAEKECARAVSALLKHGARKDARAGFHRYTPLHLAIKGQHVRVVEALLSAGPEVSLSDDLTEGTLELAARGGDTGILRLLIENGGDVNLTCPASRNTPLQTAAAFKQVGAIHALVEAGSDVNAGNEHGKTPLHFAALSGCKASVVALLGYGADQNMTDRSSRTPLHLAAAEGSHVPGSLIFDTIVDQPPSARACAGSRGFAAIVELLVRHGADVNAATHNGWTALHNAVSGDKMGSMSALIRMRAHVNVQRQLGLTPLMIAASNRSCRAAIVLLKHGADVNARDDGKCSALHWAIQYQALENVLPMVALLLEWDADETAANDAGLTALALLDDKNAAEGGSHDALGPPFIDEVRDLFARAPAQRRDRLWRRRRFLIMWRAYPDRLHAVEEAIEGCTNSMERIAEVGVHSVDGRDSSTVGALAARVAGLEEEGIFRNVVVFM